MKRQTPEAREDFTPYRDYQAAELGQNSKFTRIRAQDLPPLRSQENIHWLIKMPEAASQMHPGHRQVRTARFHLWGMPDWATLSGGEQIPAAGGPWYQGRKEPWELVAAPHLMIRWLRHGTPLSKQNELCTHRMHEY